MNTIRNYFAHCFNKISLDGNVEFIPDPKAKGKSIDFGKLYSEFIDNEEIVIAYLSKIYKQFGGPIITKKPKK